MSRKYKEREMETLIDSQDQEAHFTFLCILLFLA